MNFKRLILAYLFISYTVSSFAQIVDNDYKNNQPYENSPLSRFGLGNINQQSLINNGSMGGLTAAYRDPFSYNPQNPASLPFLKTTAFEVGFFAKNNTIQEASNSSKSWSGNFNHIALGFPTYSVINEVLDRKPRTIKWGMGLALTPYNTVGYNVYTQNKAPNTDTVTVTNNYVGSGGTYRLMVGNGVSYKGLSVGVNIGYLFGKMRYTRQTQLSSNLILPYANNFYEDYYLSGLTWNAGLQYDITLDPKSKVGEQGGKKHLIIGFYGNPSIKANTDKNILYQRTIPNYDSLTVDGQYNITGKSTLPSEYTAGVMYENGLKLKVGIEYNQAQWSQYQNDARSESLKNASQFALGAEFILDKDRLKTDEEKIRWRVGFRSGKDPRSLLGEQISRQSFSAGMALPLRVGRGAQISYLNLGLEYGEIGTSKLKEKYIKIGVGFTLNDNSWFLKRKFQ